MPDKEKPDDDDKKDAIVEKATALVNSYRRAYDSINPKQLFNLSALKNAVTAEPKQNNPEKVAEEIQKHLGEAESAITFRMQRWGNKAKCPYCKSTHVKRLAIEEQKSKEIFRYRCLDCGEEFNDDSETKLETGVPSLHTWMLCWYLLGATNSVQYIAMKLGLSVPTVELMIQHMQRIFKSNEPLKHFMPFEEWLLSHGKGYKMAMQEALAKQVERFRGFSVGQEMDTAEVRRVQKNKQKPTPK